MSESVIGLAGVLIGAAVSAVVAYWLQRVSVNERRRERYEEQIHAVQDALYESHQALDDYIAWVRRGGHHPESRDLARVRLIEGMNTFLRLNLRIGHGAVQRGAHWADWVQKVQDSADAGRWAEVDAESVERWERFGSVNETLLELLGVPDDSVSNQRSETEPRSKPVAVPSPVNRADPDA